MRRPERRARARSGGEAVQEGLGAEREEAGGHALGAGEGLVDGLEEVGVGPAVGADGLAQDGLGGEEGEELAGHVAGEGNDLAGGEVDPFGVGAGEAGDAVEAGLGGEEAGELGLLAAHDVGRAGPGGGRGGCARRGGGRGCAGGRRRRGRAGRGRRRRAPPPSRRGRRPCRRRGRRCGWPSVEPGGDDGEEGGLEAVRVQRDGAGGGGGLVGDGVARPSPRRAGWSCPKSTAIQSAVITR